MVELVIRNARVMTCDPERAGLGIIDHGAIAIAGGRIVWVGGDGEQPAARVTHDARGHLVTPGLVDCHTHAIFAGDRAAEFAQRAAGTSYLEIAASGGGIQATLGPTRSASEARLFELLDDRLDTALVHGSTTIEVKTGYDLTVDGELRLLRVIRRATARRAQRIVPTLLVHLVPADRMADRDAYVGEICDRLIPAVAREQLATSVDIYCDEGAYTLAEARRILGAAHGHGLAVRAHAGQFADLGAAELVAELGGLSADHLEVVSDAGIAALAREGVIAVMLPGACVQLRLPVPPVARLRAAGVAMAIASDFNPGSSYCEHLLIPMWLATTHYGMTLEEAWLGVTRHAARALGVTGGALVAGQRADAVIWECSEPAAVTYRYGTSWTLIEDVIVAGAAVSPQSELAAKLAGRA